MGEVTTLGHMVKAETMATNVAAVVGDMVQEQRPRNHYAVEVYASVSQIA
jgi:hypothetical protein